MTKKESDKMLGRARDVIERAISQLRVVSTDKRDQTHGDRCPCHGCRWLGDYRKMTSKPKVGNVT